MSQSYYLHKPNHPNAQKDGYIKDYRFKASEILGKPLPSGCVVHHHYDGSLVICENQGYHLLLHARTDAYAVTGDPKKRKCRYCEQYDLIENLIASHHRWDTQTYHHLTCISLYCKQWWKKHKDQVNENRRAKRKEVSTFGEKGKKFLLSM